ncbi:MAG TPA: hypothetical protein VLT90_05125 [Terriglobales bacterium]|nr:hypothetical protein [Terriglobales bacterium]
MAKKLIALVALLVVTAWAGMFPAPMLALHAVHRHPALADSGPASHQHGKPAAHACCPGLRKVAAADPLPAIFLATSEPCADQHRCCIGQAPQNAPAPAREAHHPSPDFHVIQELASDLLPSFPLTHALAIERSLSPPAVFGMVLRI